MKSGKNEFLGVLCNLYMTAILAVLPLYTGGGYWQLGDTKYILFRNISFLCLGLWLAAEIPALIKGAASAAESGEQDLSALSAVDWAVAAYGISVTASALVSSYGKLAWLGYEGWYMGAISQLIFVGLYFFVSRRYDGSGWPLYLGEAALFLVSILGLLHRLGIDPLGLLAGWNSGDWEYSHMLSTLGNINWLCGYYSAALVLAVVPWLRDRRGKVRILHYPPAAAACVLLGVQGSQGGLLILAVCMAVCFIQGRGHLAVRRRLWLLTAGFFLGMALMEQLMRVQGDKAAVVRDGNIFGRTVWYGWAAAGLVSLACFFLDRLVQGKFAAKGGRGPRTGSGEGRSPIRLTGRRKSFPEVKKAGNPMKKGRRAGGFSAVFVLSVLAVWGALSHGLDDDFGSGRGFLWRIALESFAEADGKDKLLGAGPDCYGQAVFAEKGAGAEVWKGEHWEGAVFTNAHNEVLSQLCNVGILGTVCYLAIFYAGLRRYSGTESPEEKGGQEDICRMGVLALSLYGAHALISFQQVLNTPLLFLLLGVCERQRRGGEKQKEGRDQDEVEDIQD